MPILKQGEKCVIDNYQSKVRRDWRLEITEYRLQKNSVVVPTAAKPPTARVGAK
jgi:hypothetical protein